MNKIVFYLISCLFLSSCGDGILYDCDEKILRSYSMPDGESVIEVSEMSCGAITPVATHINFISHKNEGALKEKLAIIEADPSEVLVEFPSENRLEVILLEREAEVFLCLESYTDGEITWGIVCSHADD